MGIFSNYCGLGGSGIPQHLVDEICKEHDENYDKVWDQGHNPYIEFNWADEIMLNRLAKFNQTGKRQNLIKTVAQRLWTWKQKNLASFLELPSTTQAATIPADRGKRHREDRVVPYSRAPKTPRMVEVDFRGNVVSEDEDMGTDAPAPMALTATASGSSNNNKHGETKPTPFAYAYKGISDTWTTIIPYVNNGTDDLPTTLTSEVRYQFRMNSIWDVRVQASETNEQQQGYWRDYYAALYQKYAVLGCNWKMVFTLASHHTIPHTQKFAIFYGITGKTDPPAVGATVDYNVMLQWKGFKHIICTPTTGTSVMRSTGVSQTNTTPNNIIDQLVSTGSGTNTWTIKGHWYPRQYHREVAQDADVETWTAVTANNTEEQYLTVIIVRVPPLVADLTGSNISVAALTTVLYNNHYLEHLTQFKDPQTQYLYPTTATTNFNRQTTGAG